MEGVHLKARAREGLAIEDWEAGETVDGYLEPEDVRNCESEPRVSWDLEGFIIGSFKQHSTCWFGAKNVEELWRKAELFKTFLDE